MITIWQEWGRKGDTMYQWVTDKKLLKATYSESADVVNRLVQELKKYGIRARMNVVGSKLRNMVTRNGKAPFDFDFNIWIENADQFDERSLKENVKNAFDTVLIKKKWQHCKDSTSVLTARKKSDSIYYVDVCIVKRDCYGRLQRLIHDKTGNVNDDRYIWNQFPELEKFMEKEEKLKPEHWNKVRDVYLDKKNMYLSRQDKTHKSFICYIEAVNEVYDKYYHWNNTICLNSPAIVVRR